MANKKTMDLIRSFEGLHRRRSDGLIHVYPDAGYGWKVATQGYGTTVNPETGHKLTRNSPPITREVAGKWLRMDIERKYEPPVRRMITTPLSEDSIGALVSFAYNVGIAGLRRSTLLKRVNARQFDDVTRQFLRYKYSNGKVFAGLLRRRKAEAKQFMEGLQKPVRGDLPPAVEIPPPPTRKPPQMPSEGILGAFLKSFLDWFR